jgi:hypothetical protein
VTSNSQLCLRKLSSSFEQIETAKSVGGTSVVLGIHPVQTTVRGVEKGMRDNAGATSQLSAKSIISAREKELAQDRICPVLLFTKSSVLLPLKLPNNPLREDVPLCKKNNFQKKQKKPTNLSTTKTFWYSNRE